MGGTTLAGGSVMAQFAPRLLAPISGDALCPLGVLTRYRGGGSQRVAVMCRDERGSGAREDSQVEEQNSSAAAGQSWKCARTTRRRLKERAPLAQEIGP